MLKQVTPLAQEMIKTKGLVAIVDTVLQEIQTLPLSASQTRKVEVEWEKDPEVEGWEMLSVTLWSEGSPEDARNLWRELDLAMIALRQKLSQSDLYKFNQYVSVGVDIE
jgi:hypothetical protein